MFKYKRMISCAYTILEKNCNFSIFVLIFVFKTDLVFTLNFFAFFFQSLTLGTQTASSKIRTKQAPSRVMAPARGWMSLRDCSRCSSKMNRWGWFTVCAISFWAVGENQRQHCAEYSSCLLLYLRKTGKRDVMCELRNLHFPLPSQRDYNSGS